MTQRRAADGLDIEARRQDEAQPENSRARDVHRRVRGEHRAIFAERKRVLQIHAHVRLDRRRFQRRRGLRVGVTKRTAHGQPGNLRRERLRDLAGEIFEIDRRENLCGNRVELNLVARGHAEHADLICGTLHRQQAD